MFEKTRSNFRWRYQPRNEIDILMLDYISTSDVMSTTTMILLALRAFWLPLAAAQSPDLDKATRERIAMEACSSLLIQLNQIYAVVGLELPNYMPSFHQKEFIQANGQPKTNSTQNYPSVEEQKEQIGQFNYDTDSFSSW
ncbi:hypothetical protein DSM106972_067230 [Dulcicalothrix desertica PCC 7102]|uniref:Uncharacterized protein n=1 Tax=Dulcicalothrix desertica PCC 7102 TaxID=232991 RepID=A0A433V6A9_9CYAN|nr:hypothetical protein [Dulcicalothrix desertica]RUT01626.1 hypothetical protein DSM106972_067230 [Dulcicalothrix desertica PCC 7102]